jgi:hypothetical protein
MNTNDLAEKSPVADVEKAYDTQPLLREMREDLSKLIAAFLESQKRFDEAEARNEAFRVEMRANLDVLRVEMRANDEAARKREEAFREEVIERLDNIDIKLGEVHNDQLNIRADAIKLRKRVERLEVAA